MIGIQVTKASLDQSAGNVARSLKAALEQSSRLKAYLDTQQVSDLVTLGYTTQEANTLKSAFTDADQLHSIFIGSQNLAVVKSFETFLQLVWGTGV